MGPDEIQLSRTPKIKSFTERAIDEILDIERFKRRTDEAYFKNFVEGMREAASSGRGWYHVRAYDMRNSPELSSFIGQLKEIGYKVRSQMDVDGLDGLLVEW